MAANNRELSLFEQLPDAALALVAEKIMAYRTHPRKPAPPPLAPGTQLTKKQKKARNKLLAEAQKVERWTLLDCAKTAAAVAIAGPKCPTCRPLAAEIWRLVRARVQAQGRVVNEPQADLIQPPPPPTGPVTDKSTVPQLKEMAGALGLPKTGLKAELLGRVGKVLNPLWAAYSELQRSQQAAAAGAESTVAPALRHLVDPRYHAKRAQKRAEYYRAYSSPDLRTRLIKTLLAQRGCKLREDSRLCSAYISSGTGNPEEIAITMEEMKFYFAHTSYSWDREEIMNDMREENGWVDYEDYEGVSDQAKWVALEGWVKRFPSKEIALQQPCLPDSLKNKVRKMKGV